MHVREVLTETLHRVHGTYMVRKWLSTDDRIRSSRSVLAAYWSERPSAAYVLNSSKLTWHAWRSWKSLEYLSSYQYVLKSMKSTYSVRRVAAAFLPNFLVVLHTSARTRWYVRAFIRIRFSTIWHPFPYLNPISLFGTILATMLTSLLGDILMLLTILFHPFLVVYDSWKRHEKLARADKGSDFSPFHSIVYVHHLPLTHFAPPHRSLINFKNRKWITYFCILICFIVHLSLFLSPY